MDEDSVVELFEQLGWHGRPGLTDVDIAQLEADLGVTFPPDVRAFLRWSDGGDDWLGEAYVSIHSAEDLRACNGDEFREFFPGLVHIGGNGGLEGFCLDYRADRILSPMVSVDLTNGDEDAYWPLGPSFTEAMRRLSVKGDPWPPSDTDGDL